MHSRVFEIECKKGVTEGIDYDLPEWWRDYYSDYYEELDEDEAKRDIRGWLENLDVCDDVIDFDGENAQKILKYKYETAKTKALKFLSLSFDDFKAYDGLDIVEELANIVNEKYGIWFYNPTEGEEICTLDEMLHKGGQYYLTGKVWDYHW